MPNPEFITGLDACQLSERWGLDPRMAEKLLLSAQDFWFETRRSVSIVSGYRTRAEQTALRRKGRPTAPDEISTHRSCPATGADISMGPGLVVTEKHIWGRILFMNGLRWGGGSPLDDDLVPTDWQHLDAGPR